jgi:putative drug exporter of the RND superfamily
MPRLSHAIIRFRWLVLAFWTLAATIAVPHAMRVHESLRVEGQTLLESESKHAEEMIRGQFPRPVSDFLAVALTGPIPLDSPPYHAFLDSMALQAQSQPYISRVYSYLSSPDSSLISADRHTTFFLAVVEPEEGTSAVDLVPRFREAMHATHQRVPWARSYDVFVTGGPALDYDVRTVSKDDTRKGERKSLPVATFVLVLAFGALVAALLPLLVGVLASVCAFGAVEFIAGVYPMSIFVLVIVSMVGLGVGIDYSLFIVTRFREELNHGRGPRDAAVRAIRTAGRAVVTSGLTVLLGFAALFITPTSETRSVGLGGVIVVVMAVLLSVTLLPALLSLLGRAIDRPRWLARRLAWYHAPTGWERWARWLGHHPWRAIIIGGAIVSAITWPLTQIRIGLPREGWFPPNTESTRGVQVLDEMGARGALQPVRVVLQATGENTVVGPSHLRGLVQLSDSIKADPRVAQVRSVVDVQPGFSLLRYTFLYANLAAARARSPDFYSAYLSEDAHTTLMDVLLADSTSFTSSMDVVRRIRRIAGEGLPSLEGVDVLVGGFQASSVDLQEEVLAQFPLVITLVLVTTAVMLFIAFQSLLVPIKAVVMNCLSVGGTFGIIVLVFQHGIGSALFGLAGPTEAVYVVVPVLVFAVVFGLSMDYEVFLLSRIKEAFDRTGRNDQATMEGLAATASVITSAAAIMIIVFGTFSFSRVLVAQFLGFGLAVAVLLDATLIRMVLVPSIMHIAGSWNWWPGFRPGMPLRRAVEPIPPIQVPTDSELEESDQPIEVHAPDAGP